MNEAATSATQLNEEMRDTSANIASKAVDAVKSLTSTTMDAMADQTQRVQRAVLPAVDSVTDYARSRPVYAILGAAGVGAALAILLMSTLRRSDLD